MAEGALELGLAVGDASLVLEDEQLFAVELREPTVEEAVVEATLDRVDHRGRVAWRAHPVEVRETGAEALDGVPEQQEQPGVGGGAPQESRRPGKGEVVGCPLARDGVRAAGEPAVVPLDVRGGKGDRAVPVEEVALLVEPLTGPDRGVGQDQPVPPGRARLLHADAHEVGRPGSLTGRRRRRSRVESLLPGRVAAERVEHRSARAGGEAEERLPRSILQSHRDAAPGTTQVATRARGRQTGGDRAALAA